MTRDSSAPRIVGIADTDSYVKWTAALVGAAPASWRRQMVVLETPIAVTSDQQRAALATSALPSEAVARATIDQLQERFAADPPDAVVLGARGPLARLVARMVAALPQRPVIVTGLPGISVPATRKALLYRRAADLFIVHSRRERTDFTALAESLGTRHRFALATLPFVSAAESHRDRPREAEPTDIVFAAQAIVPRERADRLRLAQLLRRVAAAHPAHRVVLKLRAARGEHQTHVEVDSYPDLLDTLGRRPSNLVISTEPMQSALDRAVGLVTVSSTAAIEAIARGIPVIALDTFGVSNELINVVFEGSGLLGDDDDLLALRFRLPSESWLEENYLHDPVEDDWVAAIETLVAERRAGTLPGTGGEAEPGGRLRAAWDRKRVLGPMDRSIAGAVALAIGIPARAVVRFRDRRRNSVPDGAAQVSRTAGASSSRWSSIPPAG